MLVFKMHHLIQFSLELDQCFCDWHWWSSWTESAGSTSEQFSRLTCPIFTGRCYIWNVRGERRYFQTKLTKSVTFSFFIAAGFWSGQSQLSSFVFSQTCGEWPLASWEWRWPSFCSVGSLACSAAAGTEVSCSMWRAYSSSWEVSWTHN